MSGLKSLPIIGGFFGTPDVPQQQPTIVTVPDTPTTEVSKDESSAAQAAKNRLLVANRNRTKTLATEGGAQGDTSTAPGQKKRLLGE